MSNNRFFRVSFFIENCDFFDAYVEGLDELKSKIASVAKNDFDEIWTEYVNASYSCWFVYTSSNGSRIVIEELDEDDYYWCQENQFPVVVAVSDGGYMKRRHVYLDLGLSFKHYVSEINFLLDDEFSKDWGEDVCLDNAKERGFYIIPNRILNIDFSEYGF